MHPAFEVIHFQAEAHDIQFLRSKTFFKASQNIFTREEITGFFNYIAANPEAGNKIPGTSGLRKIRWKAKGFGKSGGARVIYYFRDLNMPLVLLAVYPKNETARLSVRSMREISKKVDEIVDLYTWQNKETARNNRA